MSFNINYWHQVSKGGNGNNSIWHYMSTTDNVASMANQTVNKTYFQNAFTDHGIIARRGDIIFATYSNATNVASAIVLAVPCDWNANGASVMPIGI